MPENDAEIRYRFIATDESIRKAAEKFIAEIKKDFSKGIGESAKASSNEIAKATKYGFSKGFLETSKDASKKFSDIFSGIPGIKGMGKQLAPMGEAFKSASAGFQGARAAGAGIGESASAGMAAGGEAMGGMGTEGIMAGIAGSMAAMLGVAIVIMAAIAIISAFFEAVGPIIKVVMKSLAAIILILLAPILRRILPVISQLIAAFVGGAKIVSGGEEAIFDAMSKLFTGELLKPIVDLFFQVAETIVTGLAVIFFEGQKLLVNVVFKAIDLLLQGFQIVAESIAAVFDFMTGGVLHLKDNVTASFTTIRGIVESVRQGIIDNLTLMETTLLTNIHTFFVTAKVIFTDSLNAILGIISSFGSAAVSNLNNMMSGRGNIATKVVETGRGNIATKVVETLKELKPTILNPTGKSVLEKLGEVPFILPNKVNIPSDTMSMQFPVDDFISRPGGKVQPFNSEDTIIGTKGGLGGGVTVNNTFNIDAGVDATRLKGILSDFARQQARELRMRTSYHGGSYA